MSPPCAGLGKAVLWRLAVPRRLLASSKDHSVPKQDRDVLKEASPTAISFTIEDMELLA